jgi:4-methylaminobutanoate oxidase (formaldehyde-forming)
MAYIRHPSGEPVTPEHARTGSYQVNIGGHLHPATIHLRAPFDPSNHRPQGHYLH